MAPTKQLGRSDRPTWTNHNHTSRRRHGHAPIPWVADALAAVAGIGFGIVVALVVVGETGGTLASPGGWLIAVGRLCGFTGTYLLLIMVLLIARLPWLERTVGQDRLVRWHRRIGPWPIVLISLHVVTITLGYAQMTKSGPLHQLWVFLVHYPDMLAAMVAFGLIVMAGFSSIRIARQKMRYETWWIVHLYTYLALTLAFAHQIVTGVVFLGHPLTRAFWIVIWAGTAGVVVTSRFLVPIVRNYRLQLRVADVTQEGPGVYSLTVSGKHLSRLAVSGGQFFQWRFLTKDLWWHSHPYSLSALPRPPFMRVTVKGLGDQSSAVAHLRPGTRVFVEGPYGTFTRHARTTDRVVLIGAGVGITPLRALLEDLPTNVDVSVVIRASSPADTVHRDEVEALVRLRKGTFHELVGSRHDVAFDAGAMRKLLPRIAQSDVYVCGPSGFTDDVVASALKLGVPRPRIHHEAFTF